jgi:hypothetical protein
MALITGILAVLAVLGIELPVAHCAVRPRPRRARVILDEAHGFPHVERLDVRDLAAISTWGSQ